MARYDRICSALVLFAIFAACCGLAWYCNTALSAPPSTPQIVLPCQVVEVYDGDTITVQVAVQMRVRLLDCWAPEIKTRNTREKTAGLASAQFLKDHATGRSGVLVVPLDHTGRLDNLFTFGRILGHVHLNGDRDSLSELMVKKGHAYCTKEDLRNALK